MSTLRRFWFIFDVPVFGEGRCVQTPCGVTAENREMALEVVRQRVFRGAQLPTLVRAIEDVDVYMLEPVFLPHIGAPEREGVWFPADNLSDEERQWCKRPGLWLQWNFWIPLVAWWTHRDPNVVMSKKLERRRHKSDRQPTHQDEPKRSGT
jgi:hypothetical protein